MPASDPIGEILVQADELQHRVRELGAEITRDYAGRDLLLIGVLKGAVFFLADLMRADRRRRARSTSWPSSSYGSLDRLLRRGADPQGPRRPDRGQRRADRRGHRRLRADAQYLMRTLRARPASLEVCALLIKPERRKVEVPSATSASRSPTSSRSATGWTTRSATATCPTSPRCHGEGSSPLKRRRPSAVRERIRSAPRLAWAPRTLVALIPLTRSSSPARGKRVAS